MNSTSTVSCSCRAVPWKKPWERPRVSTAVAPGGRQSAFTLVELLVVMGIILLMLIAVVPAMKSLSGSGSRKGAVGNLMSGLEQARQLAISDGRNTYIAFATSLPAGVTASVVTDYSYKAFAVFEDDSTAAAKVQISKWQKLPTGISFRSQDGGCLTSSANTTTSSFGFPPAGVAITCPYLQFDPTGGVVQPATFLRLVVFEGSASSASESPTARDSTGQPVREEIQITKFSGRSKYIVQ